MISVSCQATEILYRLICLDEHQSYEDENRVPPWEENDGYYGILSRLVRTAAANFIWSVRASYDTNTLNRDQMVNHYARNGCFTTKVNWPMLLPAERERETRPASFRPAFATASVIYLGFILAVPRSSSLDATKYHTTTIKLPSSVSDALATRSRHNAIVRRHFRR